MFRDFTINLSNNIYLKTTLKTNVERIERRKTRCY